MVNDVVVSILFTFIKILMLLVMLILIILVIVNIVSDGNSICSDTLLTKTGIHYSPNSV